jgi:hypothetical protein
MDFSRVLVTDRLAWEIFGAAAQEKLLFVRQPDEQRPQTWPGAARQRALSLLVLFDSLILHENGEGTFRLPYLEKEGIVQIIPTTYVKNVPALTTQWRRGLLSKNLLQGASLICQFRPFIINRLLKDNNNFGKSAANILGGSQRKYLNLFFDFVLAVFRCDKIAIRGEVNP